jgi:hypothetical protein
VWLSITGADGVVKTYVVSAGNEFNPFSGQSGPLPANVLDTLQNIAKALDTVYLQVVSFSFDRTQSYVSPKSGANVQTLAD